MDLNDRDRPASISYLPKVKMKNKELKVILLGDPGVGKTNIINRFLFGSFDEISKPTLGSSFFDKPLERDDYIYTLKVWDTSGQEKYNSITKLFVKDSQIVLLVYSIDNLKSFENIKFWFDFIKDELSRDEYILAIVGNKKDLFEKEVVDEEQAKNLANDLNANFFLISAKFDKQSIDKIFDILLDEYISSIDIINKPRKESIKIKKEVDKKKCC